MSRAVLAWRLSNTLGAEFCVEALEEALARYGRPEIFNTDQGSQFTSDDFTGTLERYAIAISMDGKGRFMDNIFVERLWRSLKYEEVYLNAYASVAEAGTGIGGWLDFSASIRALSTARHSKSTKRAYGYMDDRLRRPVALPPLPEPARKAGNARLRPTYPQAPQSTKGLMLVIWKAEPSHQPLR